MDSQLDIDDDSPTQPLQPKPLQLLNQLLNEDLQGRPPPSVPRPLEISNGRIVPSLRPTFNPEIYEPVLAAPPSLGRRIKEWFRTSK